MSLLKKVFGIEKRSMSVKDAQGWETILGPRTSSGVTVSPQRAMSVPAALSAIRLLSESVASLPLVLYRKDRQGGRERATDHPLHRLLHGSPNDRQTAFMLKEVIMLGLLTDGNGYCLVDWQENGQPSALWPVESNKVYIDQDPATGRIVYKVTLGTGMIDVAPENILHVPGLCFDGLRGYSIIFAAREALGSAISELSHGATFFQNAAMPSGVLTHPGKLREETSEKLRSYWNQAYGNPSQAHRTALLEEGLKYEQISINNKDSQWLESRAFSVKEVARIFRLPPHLLGDLERASYSSIEQQNLEFLQYTLRPWLTRIEQSINLKLLTPKEQKSLYAEFTTADFLRADTKTRFESYEVALRSGWLNVNEVRQRENMPPVDGGDAHLFQLNMAPLNEAQNQRRGHSEAHLATKPKIEYRSIARETNKAKIEGAVRELLDEEGSTLLSLIDDNSSEAEIKEILQRYYEERGPAVKAKMQPLFAGMTQALQRAAAEKANAVPWSEAEMVPFVERQAETFSSKHVGIGLTMALAAAALPEPKRELAETFEAALEARPSKAAHLSSTALEADTAYETFRKAGVTKLQWVTEQDACEFCAQLSGKIVGIEQPFVREGEEIPGPGGQAAGLTARSPRISPPLHLGCHCSIQPVDI